MKNVGILGLGNIARKMAFTINEMEEVNLYAVASRDIEKQKLLKVNMKLMLHMVISRISK